MKKLLLTGVIGISVIAALTGCNPGPLHFEGKLLPSEQVEEIIEDRLENENGIDLEVNIIEESED